MLGPAAPTSTEREVPDLQGAMLRLKLSRYSADGALSEKTVRLEVMGVLKPVGWRHDYNIYLPLRDVLEFNTWAQGKRRDPSRQGYAEVLVRTTSARETLEVEQVLSERGFSVYSERQQVEQANAYFAQVQAILGGIGGIALLVAAFGIANTMLMAIYERTREIGLMKAIGASNKDVMNVFLAEAGGIGLLGGLAGIVLGMLVNVVINVIGQGVAAEQIAASAVDMGNRTSVTYTPLWLPLFAIVFAGLVGVLSGAYPASRAANLSPIRALKYE
jgi:putative ABC transport system permease protein